MERLALPTERKVWEVEHGTVVFDLHDNHLPSFYTEVEDQCDYLREWRVGRLPKLAKQEDYVPYRSNMYRSSVFQRHGCRQYHPMEAQECTQLMEQFHHLLENHLSLLFNPTGTLIRGVSRPRHVGFVHFSECVLLGEVPHGRIFQSLFLYYWS